MRLISHLLKQCTYISANLHWGYSKYESMTLTLGELGRLPIHNKAISISLSYWTRLEQGTESLILSKAFNECKTQNHKWYNDIQYLLKSNGLQNILDKNIHPICKSLVYQRLNDLYCQKYTSITENKTNT